MEGLLATSSFASTLLASTTPLPLYPTPKLLNRLDKETSGMVLAALHDGGLALWHKAEEAGQIEKYYLALAHGTLSEKRTITLALNTDNRRITTVLTSSTPDYLRHTIVTPLKECSFHGMATTLVLCQIIKAHATKYVTHGSH